MTTIEEAYTTLQMAMHEDNQYAWAWQCNMVMPIYDILRSEKWGFDHEKAGKLANQCGEAIMMHFFHVNAFEPKDIKVNS